MMRGEPRYFVAYARSMRGLLPSRHLTDAKGRRFSASVPWAAPGKLETRKRAFTTAFGRKNPGVHYKERRFRVIVCSEIPMEHPMLPGVPRRLPVGIEIVGHGKTGFSAGERPRFF